MSWAGVVGCSFISKDQLSLVSDGATPQGSVALVMIHINRMFAKRIFPSFQAVTGPSSYEI
jgi:hypothetical protein